MKKLLSLMLAAAVCFLTACNNGSDTSGDSSAAEEVDFYERVFTSSERYYISCNAPSGGIPDVSGVQKPDSDEFLLQRLPQAVADDKTGKAKGLVEDILAEDDLETRFELTDELLHVICGTSDTNDTNELFSDKKLKIIRTFWGTGDIIEPPSDTTQAEYLEKAYRNITERYTFAMIHSSVYQDMSYIKGSRTASGATVPYMGLFSEHMYEGLKSDITEKRFRDCCLALRNYEKYSDRSFRMTNDFRAYVESRLSESGEYETASRALALIDECAYGSTRGTDASNELSGTDGLDVLYGLGGDDTLNGGAGSDLLIGGDGNDTLNGGAGADCMQGNAGNDVYVFGKGSGNDIIVDFDGENILRFEGLTADMITVSRVTVKDFENDVLVRISGSNDTLTIRNYFNDQRFRRFKLEFGGTEMAIDDPGSPFANIE